MTISGVTNAVYGNEPNKGDREQLDSVDLSAYGLDSFHIGLLLKTYGGDDHLISKKEFEQAQKDGVITVNSGTPPTITVNEHALLAASILQGADDVNAKALEAFGLTPEQAKELVTSYGDGESINRDQLIAAFESGDLKATGELDPISLNPTLTFESEKSTAVSQIVGDKEKVDAAALAQSLGISVEQAQVIINTYGDGTKIGEAGLEKAINDEVIIVEQTDSSAPFTFKVDNDVLAVKAILGDQDQVGEKRLMDLGLSEAEAAEIIAQYGKDGSIDAEGLNNALASGELIADTSKNPIVLSVSKDFAVDSDSKDDNNANKLFSTYAGDDKELGVSEMDQALVNGPGSVDPAVLLALREAYDADGNGAISETEMDQALADGAIVLNDQGQIVSVNEDAIAIRAVLGFQPGGSGSTETLSALDIYALAGGKMTLDQAIQFVAEHKDNVDDGDGLSFADLMKAVEEGKLDFKFFDTGIGIIFTVGESEAQKTQVGSGNFEVSESSQTVKGALEYNE